MTIRGRFVNQRLAPVPMEPEAILVAPEGGRLMVWVTSQTPFGLRAELASSLGMAPGEIRVVVGDMGGGFGAKAGARPELIVVAAAARKLGRPVKWIETRSENLIGMTHGRGQVQEVELGATRDGRLVGLRARVVADLGAYPGIAMLLPAREEVRDGLDPGMRMRADAVRARLDLERPEVVEEDPRTDRMALAKRQRAAHGESPHRRRLRRGDVRDRTRGLLERGAHHALSTL